MSKYKYMRLAEQLKEEILTYRSPGKRIPTEDELAEQFSMSRNTVRQAVQMLVEDGFLIKIQGSGTFVSEKLGATAKSRANLEKSRCIGVVMNQVNAYIFPSMLMGISDYLLEHNYHMILRMTLGQIAREEEALSSLLDADVAGFIIEPTRSGLPIVNHRLYDRIREQCPCILMHAELPQWGFPTVDNSNVKGVGMLVDHLVAHGHRNIAALCKSDEHSGGKRFFGYVEGLRRHGIKLDETRVLWYTDEDFEELFSDANAHRVLKTIKDCTAAACFNDDLGKRFLAFLERQRIRVPEDFSVVGFDDMQGHMTKPLTTIAHPKEKMGRAAAEGILALIGNPSAEVTVYFEPELVVHQSVAAAPTAAVLV